jgi:hypothetical protein
MNVMGRFDVVASHANSSTYNRTSVRKTGTDVLISTSRLICGYYLQQSHISKPMAEVLLRSLMWQMLYQEEARWRTRYNSQGWHLQYKEMISSWDGLADMALEPINTVILSEVSKYFITCFATLSRVNENY